MQETHTISIDSDRKARAFMVIEYHAMNGQVFTAKVEWYKMQEGLDECSRQAYENDTAVSFVVIS